MEIGILAADARHDAEGYDSDFAHGDVERSASTDGGVEGETSTGGELLAGVRNIISCVTQLIDGLCRCNHKYSSTAEGERSNRVRRKQTGSRVPQGKSTLRVTY